MFGFGRNYTIMIITIVFDNEAPPQFKSDWGFSCLIESPFTTLLFDTGANSDILLENMKALNIDPKKIQAVMLSHDHWDHTGGLNGLLNVIPNIAIYKPTFSNKPTEVFPNIITTGTLGGRYSIQEQSLICKTKAGLVVITGCSHPGLGHILEIAKKFGPVHAIIGGFHGFDKFEVLNGVSIIMPCHCTSHKEEIKRLFPDVFTSGGVGKKLEFSDKKK